MTTTKLPEMKDWKWFTSSLEEWKWWELSPGRGCTKPFLECAWLIGLTFRQAKGRTFGTSVRDMWAVTPSGILMHVNGVEIDNLERNDCESCAVGKSWRNPRKSVSLEEKVAEKPWNTVYTDVVIPMKPKSVGKSKYSITELDFFSGKSVVSFILRRSEAAEAVKDMIGEAENLFNRLVRRLTMMHRSTVKWRCSDRGGKSTGGDFKRSLRHKGTVH